MFHEVYGQSQRSGSDVARSQRPLRAPRRTFLKPAAAGFRNVLWVAVKLTRVAVYDSRECSRYSCRFSRRCKAASLSQAKTGLNFSISREIVIRSLVV